MSETIDAPRTALAVLPASAVSTIVAADKDDLLGKIAAKVAAFRPDVSTSAGRDEMRSLAYEIAKAKTALDKIGLGLTEQARKVTAAVNAERKILNERMDELRDKVREQLTAWEDAEKTRVAGHEAALRDILALAVLPPDAASADVCSLLDELGALPARDWREFAERASYAVAETRDKLTSALAAAEHREAEAAELARLRAAEEERQREEAARAAAERDRRIAAEAAEAARQAAEAEAQRLLAEERARAAREAEAAAAAAREAEARAAQAEADRLSAIAKAEADAAALAAQVEADRAAAVQRAERERAAAVEAERQRAAREAEATRAAKAAEEAEAQRRAANVAHRKRINGEALAAITALGMTVEQGQAVIKAIAFGQVPHVSIQY